jgi:hypothetical protein
MLYLNEAQRFETIESKELSPEALVYYIKSEWIRSLDDIHRAEVKFGISALISHPLPKFEDKEDRELGEMIAENRAIYDDAVETAIIEDPIMIKLNAVTNAGEALPRSKRVRRTMVAHYLYSLQLAGISHLNNSVEDQLTESNNHPSNNQLDGAA